MQTIKTWVCIAILFVCAFSSGWAQGGPPLVTDDTETPGNKKWEICIAGTSERRYPDEQRFEAPLLDINYGVGKNLELNYQLPLLVTANRNESGLAGLGDSEVGIKWRFLDEDKKNVAMSVFPQFTFNNPTSSVRRGLAENDQRFFLPFELQKSLGPFGINFEAGPSFHFNTPDEWESGVALSHSFGRSRGGGRNPRHSPGRLSERRPNFQCWFALPN